MLKFFRKIRQKLIAEGNLKKYLIYAAGEVLLVMIGILLALQVNKWKEQRKAKKQEFLLIKQLQIDMKSNLDGVVDLNKRLYYNSMGIDSFIVRLDKKNYDIMVPVFLAQALRKTDFNNASSGYNMMQNGKASLISDETVLKHILSLYENDFPDIIGRQNDMKNSIEFIQRNFVNKLFIKSENKLSIKLMNSMKLPLIFLYL